MDATPGITGAGDFAVNQSTMEKFSSFLDGEVPEAELEACIDRLLMDAEWQRRWDQAHKTRSLLAGHGTMQAGSHFSERVAAHLDPDPHE